MKNLFYLVLFWVLISPSAQGLRCQEVAPLHTDFLRRWCLGGFQIDKSEFHLTFIEWHEKQDGGHLEKLNTYHFDVNNVEKTLVDSRYKDGWMHGVLFQKTSSGWLRLINEFPNMFEKPTVFIEEYDSQGNLQSTVNIDFPQLSGLSDSIRWTAISFLKTNQNTYLFSGSSTLNFNKEFWAEFDINGNQLNFVERSESGYPTIIFQREDGKYGAIKRKYNHLEILNEDFSLDTNYTDTIIKFPSHNQFYYKDSLLFIAGTRVGKGLDFSRYEFSQVINAYNGKIERYIEIQFPNNATSANPGLRGFDVFEDYVFISNSFGSRYCNVFGGVSDTCTNYFSVQKISKSGTIQWSRYFGGDAAYFVNTIVATKDSGCLVIVDRRDMPNQEFHEVYYVKLDKDGHVEADYFKGLGFFSSVSEIKSAESNNFNIFPNPTNGKLTITTKSTAPFDVQIVNINGKVVKQVHQLIANQSLFVDDLSNGIYFLQIQTPTTTEMLKFVKY